MKTVSVHIVTFNSAKYIHDCLLAILNQSYPVENIIIVDNASRDETCKLLQEFSDRVDLIRNNNNEGFAAAHNQAIKRTTSDYCLILNPDVKLHPDYLYELIHYAEEHPDQHIGSLTGKLLLQSDSNIVDSCGLSINRARRAFDLGSGESSNNWTEVRQVFGVSGAAALYTREMINDVSFEGEFFDELFFAYKEDVDVAWRAQLFGWNSVFIPKALAYHERGWKTGGRKSQPLFVRRLSYINRYKMMVKNDRWKYVLSHIPSLLFYEGLSLVYAIIREPRLLGSWKSLYRDRKRLKAWRSYIHTNPDRNYQKNYSFFHN